MLVPWNRTPCFPHSGQGKSELLFPCTASELEKPSVPSLFPSVGPWSHVVILDLTAGESDLLLSVGWQAPVLITSLVQFKSSVQPSWWVVETDLLSSYGLYYGRDWFCFFVPKYYLEPGFNHLWFWLNGQDQLEGNLCTVSNIGQLIGKKTNPEQIEHYLLLLEFGTFWNWDSGMPKKEFHGGARHENKAEGVI